jgi:hypothetical protein
MGLESVYMWTRSSKLEILSLIIITSIILAIFILILPSASAGPCISASMGETEFEVDNSNGLTSQAFEIELEIRNDCGSPMNITMVFTFPIGGDTGATKQVYPHFFTEERRRNDRKMEYSVQVEEGTTTFYPLIESNESVFADLYTFACRITNDDDGGAEVESIPMSVHVTEYNDIRIELTTKEGRQKTVRPGSETEYYIVLINKGNIYRQIVSVQIENSYPLNISVFEPELPSDRSFINPEFFSDEHSVIIAVKLGANETAGPDTYSFEITPETPGHEPNFHGHPSVEVRLTVTKESSPPPPPPPNTPPQIPQEFILAAIVSLILALGRIYRFGVRGRVSTGDHGWDEQESWGDDEWKSSPSESTIATTEELEIAITSPFSGHQHIDPDHSTDSKSSQHRSEVPLFSTTPSKGTPPSLILPKFHRSASLQPSPFPSLPNALVRISCPKCSINMRISNPRRPLVIRCPTCQVKIKLKGKVSSSKSPSTTMNTAISQKSSFPSPKDHPTTTVLRIICPSCSVKIKVANPKRPLRISCPKCTSTLRLK